MFKDTNQLKIVVFFDDKLLIFIIYFRCYIVNISILKYNKLLSIILVI